MAVAFLVLITVSILLGIYFLWSRRRFYKLAWQLPGPLGLPFIGVGLNMMNPEKFLQFMERKSRLHSSPFVTWMGPNCFLYAGDPDTVETVFNSPHCTNKGEFYRFIASAIGDGLFTSSSPRWNKHRRLINPAFSRQVINNFLPIFNAEADELLSKFAAAAETGEKLEIYEMLKKSVLEAACQTTMGKKMNFQNDGSSLIFDSYNGITDVCVRRGLSPWYYPDAIYRLSSLFTRERKFVNVLFNFVENLLESSAKLDEAPLPASNPSKASCSQQIRIAGTAEGGGRQTSATESGAQDDIAYCIRKSKSIFVEQVRSCVEQGQLSWEDVRDEANVTIAATFETTSTALYLVCLCLAMHPEYQEKLYAELVELFPVSRCKCTSPANTVGNSNGDSCNCKYDFHSTQVSNEQLERMTYTEMVINEAMRLFAPVPLVLRSASSDFRLRDGITIPQGTQICIDIFNMQRNERYWGKNAKNFRPELHFGVNTSKATDSTTDRNSASGIHGVHHPFAFVPFTKGLRMCIGYRYALMLMKVLIAKIFRNFYIRTNARPEDLTIKGTISLKLREYPLCELVAR